MATDHEKVKLLGFWASPFVRRVEWALKLKGIDYEYIEDDIFNKSPLLLKLNPIHKKVPVLVHGDKVVSESYIILEYIDETWKHQKPLLLPQDPYQRALSRFWAKFAEENLLVPAYRGLIFYPIGEEQEKALKSTIGALEIIEGELMGKNKNLHGGESIGYLDIAIGWISHWLPLWDEIGGKQILDPLKFPTTISWMNKFRSHPLIKDNLPPRDELLAYFLGRREYFLSKKI